MKIGFESLVWVEDGTDRKFACYTIDRADDDDRTAGGGDIVVSCCSDISRLTEAEH